jgi:Ribonuclease G/E
MKLRIDRSSIFHVFAVEDKGVLADLRLWAERDQDPSYVLFLARVKKILPAVNGAILDLGDRDAYLGWQDLDPARRAQGEKIDHILKLEDRLLVQIRREESGDKADKATLRIAIPGAYGVYLAREPGVSISSKIRDQKVRSQLQDLLDLEASEGVIFRTLAAEADADAVKDEITRLRAAFQAVDQAALHAKSLGAFPLNLAPEPAFFARWLKQADSLVSNDKNDEHLAADWGLAFELNQGPLDPVWADFSALRARRVPLFGLQADILVEEMETLTAIDVNRKSQAAASVAEVDRQAVREAMRQLRLRNIGGMVVVDVIDKRRSARTTREATAAKKEDSHPIRVYGPTAMGLIELVRTKRGASLMQLTGSAGRPSQAYALWRLAMAIRKGPKTGKVIIQGSRDLIQVLEANSQWKEWEIPGNWTGMVLESRENQEEFLRILPSLRK